MFWVLQNNIRAYTSNCIGLFITSIVCQEWGLLLQRSSCPVEKGLGMVSAIGSAGERVGEVGGWSFRELWGNDTLYKACEFCIDLTRQ